MTYWMKWVTVRIHSHLMAFVTFVQLADSNLLSTHSIKHPNTSTWKWHISPECLRTETDYILNVSVGRCRSRRTFFPPPSPVLLSAGVVEAGLPPSSCRCVRLQITMAGEHTLFDLHIISSPFMWLRSLFLLLWSRWLSGSTFVCWSVL